jgi:ATP-dependent Lon protease
MSSFQDLSFSLEEFTGSVRLFPLPNLVLFPHVMQPLHIFEQRYRCLLEDALATDRLIAMALLEPGWENDYEGRPPLTSMACVGRVATYHRLPDGTYNLLLLGLQRVKLLREFEPRRLYREAEVMLCEDRYPSGAEAAGRALRQKLRKAFLRILPALPEAQEQIDQLLASDLSLGVLTDVISFMLDIDVRKKETLLGELNVYHRAEMLLAHLAAAVAGREERGSAREFPLKFSVN